MKTTPQPVSEKDHDLIGKVIVGDGMAKVVQVVLSRRDAALVAASEDRVIAGDFPNVAPDIANNMRLADRYSAFLSVLKELQGDLGNKTLAVLKIEGTAFSDINIK